MTYTFLSVIIFTSNLANKTEIVAILSSGISFSRFLRPYLIGASFIGVFFFLVGMYVLPNSSKEFNEFKYEYINPNRKTRETTNVYRQINDNDYILFWGESPHKWKRNTSGYYHQTNIYSESSVYFMTFGGADGKRIETVNASTNSPTASFTTYDYLSFYEKEEHKIYHSGKAYHGDRYLETGSKTFTINVPNPAAGVPASLKVAFAGEGPSSSVQYVLNGQNIASIGGLYGSDDATDYKYTQSETSYVVNSYGASNSLTINYTKNGNKSIGYLDYYEFQGKSNMVLSNQLLMHQGEAAGNGTTELLLQNSGRSYTIWDVTNPSKFEQKLSTDIGSEHTVTKLYVGLSANVAENLAVKLSVTANHQSEVRGDTEELDTLTAFTLVYNF